MCGYLGGQDQGSETRGQRAPARLCREQSPPERGQEWGDGCQRATSLLEGRELPPTGRPGGLMPGGGLVGEAGGREGGAAPGRCLTWGPAAAHWAAASARAARVQLARTTNPFGSPGAASTRAAFTDVVPRSMPRVTEGEVMTAGTLAARFSGRNAPSRDLLPCRGGASPNMATARLFIGRGKRSPAPKAGLATEWQREAGVGDPNPRLRNYNSQCSRFVKTTTPRVHRDQAALGESGDQVRWLLARPLLNLPASEAPRPSLQPLRFTEAAAFEVSKERRGPSSQPRSHFQVGPSEAQRPGYSIDGLGKLSLCRDTPATS